MEDNNQIRQYKILNQEVKSMIGDVYKAINTNNDKFVTLTIIEQNFDNDRKQLQRDLEIMIQVNNDNIVKFIEIFTLIQKEKEKIYIVQEYCCHYSLKYYLFKQNIQNDDSIILFKQILNAFISLRKLKVIHKDLNANNIFIQEGKVKLMDFGYCKEKDEENQDPELYKKVIPSLAPEVIRNKQINSKTDIYSLGVILYLLQFRKYPYQSKCHYQLLQDQKKMNIDFNANGIKISQSIQNLITGMMQFDINKRYNWKDIYSHSIFSQEEQKLFQEKYQQDKQIFEEFDSKENENIGQKIDNQKDLITQINYFKTLIDDQNRKNQNYQDIIQQLQYENTQKDKTIKFLQKENELIQRQLSILIKQENTNSSEIQNIKKNESQPFSNKEIILKAQMEFSKQQKVIYRPIEEFKKLYEMCGNLGQGSYGAVQKLRFKEEKNQNQQQQQLAVKILNCLENGNTQEDQEKEILALQHISILPQHLRKYIIDLKAAYFNDQTYEIYMIIPQAIKSFNQDILIRQKQQKYYDPKDLYYKLGCVLTGLQSLESVGLVHRDIKPQNMLIMEDSSIVLADYGTAKKITNLMSVQTGTPSYFSPELVMNFGSHQNQEYFQQNTSIQDQKANDLYGVGQSFVFAASLLLPPQSGNSSTWYFDYNQKRKVWLEQAFQQIRQQAKYSEEFVALLENMVNNDSSLRKNLHQCLETLVNLQDW